MRTLKIDVGNSTYKHIIFFFKSLPANLIRISSMKNTNIKTSQDTGDLAIMETEYA